MNAVLFFAACGMLGAAAGWWAYGRRQKARRRQDIKDKYAPPQPTDRRQP